jgi:hypothetical protein
MQNMVGFIKQVYTDFPKICISLSNRITLFAVHCMAALLTHFYHRVIYNRIIFMQNLMYAEI